MTARPSAAYTMHRPFSLVSSFEPTGDQPNAISQLVEGIEAGRPAQTLLGITGSGKTFTIANVIARTQRPTLIIAPNKTLAAQLYNEYKELFPQNAVEFFVSYYDYYQPEAYVPSSDTYIEKDANINDAIDRMRHAATHSLLTRNDVIIVASVSCIYGLGTAEAYVGMMAFVQRGEQLERDEFLRQLVRIQYNRAQIDFERGSFRVRGDCVEVFPAYENSRAVRIQFFGDEIERIVEIDALRGRVLNELDKIAIFPASHYVVTPERKQIAIENIKTELTQRVEQFRLEERLIEAQRLEQRTQYDLEMLITMGYCNGIENYSRHLTGRSPGEAPPCLLNYLPSDFLLFIDESHVTVPQIGGMYRGDRARKQTLVDYGFRLPSALDNRPLNFEEFEDIAKRLIFVSATPGEYELERSSGVVVEQLVRPTGLLDPALEIRPAVDQVDDAIKEIRVAVAAQMRVLVTTLTKRMAEDLSEFLAEIGIKVRYLHSDIDTLERSSILRDLRRGVFDVLVGINLLREGLDLPEVGLVCILDADKEGFLRSHRSLIQTIGRASRNAEGRAILYADHETESMRSAVSETRRRRSVQEAYNQAHDIVPQTIIKAIQDLGEHVPVQSDETQPAASAEKEAKLSLEKVPSRIEKLKKQMKAAAARLEFEDAAILRDRIKRLEARLLGLEQDTSPQAF
ncbi:MAG: excinuclease ABC subunit UvrB [Myxococcota bacterium]|jgi:excinuclease ABC subunit B|nr:excinuclease ABC subunit UvrB [Myxococcota bacterium]